ncbi:proline racemase family protein [Azohydromonas australica]|uniref:proline racemase family protein n=1 Tax=Azohydromonas australica TaxID=364039 RepID=UPI0005BD1D03|nr:proline racemase family protein [Azohydromonas australica]
MATVHAKGQLSLNHDFRHQGMLGNVYTGRLVEATTLGGRHAVMPTIIGRSWSQSLNTFVLDPDDPFTEGFSPGDIWA